MANMSYCRFQNTATDLFDCEEHVDDDLSGPLDEYEREARERLVATCYRIAKEYGQKYGKLS